MKNIEPIKNLLNNVEQVVKYYDKTFETTGQAFSIFHACDIVRNEVVLHTRFIGYLLNPKAGHMQKDKFLKLFFDTLEIKESTEGFQVEIEKPIGRVNQETIEGGRIDIFISNPSKKLAFAIEVKIWAEEQENQLGRYFDYIQKTTNNANDNSVLFLTLFGEESKCEKMIDKYKKVSFADNIVNWIESCKLACIDQPIIRETLTQYSNAIKSLTHQNIDNHMNDEIINLITKDENSFKAFEALQNISSNVYSKFINSLVSNLRENENLKGLFEIEVPSKIEIKEDFSILFKRDDKTTPKIYLYWLNKGIVGIGMHGGGDDVEKPIREEMNSILKQRGFNNKCLNQGNSYRNWYCLAEVAELNGHPRLPSESWKLFNDDDLAEKIGEWVTFIYEAYQELTLHK
ncbi:PD-(D/E)XK nuclease family protein [Belliella kenyensis]|uniref:PD-(D/E)XK nuclease family protein n=1 Tax=Belliella kenyensis TaxID=1472724 RepID=A0ABV8EP89_9BACT|nr:PD-(D/E)XK nuclease family protein [Belliella kenyensis]MCH7402875.1 PD-(D/E)XK nuclease family protein [Belliella kenyensis]MDN3602581.1 PD-(D/E)XK nuclease family protein [Belliella kenyensis]